jgi:hypothetical protein
MSVNARVRGAGCGGGAAADVGWREPDCAGASGSGHGDGDGDGGAAGLSPYQAESGGRLPLPHRLYHPSNDLLQDRRRRGEIQAGKTFVFRAKGFAKIQSDLGMIQEELPSRTR